MGKKSVSEAKYVELVNEEGCEGVFPRNSVSQIR